MENYRVYQDDWLFIVERRTTLFSVGSRSIGFWHEIEAFRDKAQAIGYAKRQYAKDIEDGQAVHGVVWSGEKVDD